MTLYLVLIYFTENSDKKEEMQLFRKDRKCTCRVGVAWASYMLQEACKDPFERGRENVGTDERFAR